MLALKTWRETAKGLPDLLEYAAVIDDGIVSTKSGALLAAWIYEGRDMTSASATEKNQLTVHVNAALSVLGNGWMTHHDAVRVEVDPYFPEQRWPDPVSELIDDERREYFSGQGSHYETVQVLSVSYLPPVTQSSRLGQWVYGESQDRKTIADRELEKFQTVISELEGRLSSHYRLARLKGVKVLGAHGRERVHDELLSYLQWAITGIRQPIQLPPCPMYLDALIGAQDFIGGTVPKIGDHHIRVVSIDGFPQESHAELLEGLDTLPIPYRWSTRFIYLDSWEADAELEKYRKKWEQRKRPIRDQIFGTKDGKIDLDALSMEEDVVAAKADASAGLVRYGYFSTAIIVMDKDDNRALDHAQRIATVIRNSGFNARIEQENAIEAWLGALPGNYWANVRRPVMHTLNLSHLLPLSTIWAGERFNPCAMYPPNSPPLMMGATQGSTPFRVNLHVSDVGHTAILGPTGTGKSTLLQLAALQARRYPNATIVCFDKRYSGYIPTQAVGGAHYDIAGDYNEIAFAPFSRLEGEKDLSWATGWVEMCVQLQGVNVTPTHRKAIGEAVRLVALSEHRTFTALAATIQDAELRTALEPYLVGAEFGELFDAEQDQIVENNWITFEINSLMSLGPRAVLPALSYLFHLIESRMQGQPGFLFLDEVWMMLGHDVFREKLREWLKELRKMNWSVVMATQSLSDAKRSGILDVINESCPTKIFLANPYAEQKEAAALYADMGVTASQRRVIANMVPKREYFLTSPLGARRFSLDIGPIGLAIAAASSSEEIQEARALIKKNPDGWVFEYLQRRGLWG